MNRAMWKLAHDLRDLADQLDSGDLPDKGVAVELGRKVEAALNERRPKRRPHDRAKQARELARLLSKRTGVDVTLSYSPHKGYDGKATGWKIEWADGPTYDAMRELVPTLADRVPALDIAKLSYERGATYKAQVAAMLRYLDEHPDDGQRYARQHYSEYTGKWYDDLDQLSENTHWRTDYPERIEEQTERRIQAIYSLPGRDGKRIWGEPHPDAYARLAEKIRTAGWPASRDWLDQIANGSDNSDVANLADVRRNRGQVTAW